MEIKKITIKVQASLNYQVAAMEAEVENYSEMELAQFKQYLVNECSNTVRTLSNTVGQTHTQSQPKTEVTTSKAPYQTSRTVQNQGYTQGSFYDPGKPVSEAQLKYIKGLGYTGPLPATFTEADQLLKKLKAEKGIQ